MSDYGVQLYDTSGNRISLQDSILPKYIDEIEIGAANRHGTRNYSIPDYLYLSASVFPKEGFLTYEIGSDGDIYRRFLMPQVRVSGSTLIWDYHDTLYMGLPNQTPIYTPCRILIWAF